MPRVKLRPDWSVKNYCFRAWVDEAQTAVWDHARALNQAWNQITLIDREQESAAVELGQETDRINTEINQLKIESGLASSIISLEKRLEQLNAEQFKRLGERDKAVRQQLRQAAELGDQDREALAASFQTARGNARQRAGAIHLRMSLEKIRFVNRYSSGGSQVTHLLNSLNRLRTNVKPRLKVPGASHRTVAWIKVSAERSGKIFAAGVMRVGAARAQVHFQVLFHRLPPAAGFIKSIALIARRSAAHGWIWHLMLTVELPPQREPGVVLSAPPLPVAAIDFGWRRINDYLRIAVIVDAHGHSYELRLPLADGENRKLRKLREYWQRQNKNLYDTPLSHQELWDWQAKFNAKTEAVKTVLRQQSEAGSFTGELNDYLKQHLARMRDGGLKKVLRLLRTDLAAANAASRATIQHDNDDSTAVTVAPNMVAAEPSNGNAETFDSTTDEIPASQILRSIEALLAGWLGEKTEAARRAALFRERWQRRRNTIYRQTVKWLAANFSRLAADTDFNLARTAQAIAGASLKTDAALVRSGKYRTVAALSYLIKFLNEQPDFLIPRRLAESRRCWLCEGEIVGDRRLVAVECVNSHRIDQDQAACFELLKQLPVGIEHSAAGAAAIVPAHLKKYIHPL